MKIRDVNPGNIWRHRGLEFEVVVVWVSVETNYPHVTTRRIDQSAVEESGLLFRLSLLFEETGIIDPEMDEPGFKELFEFVSEG